MCKTKLLFIILLNIFLTNFAWAGYLVEISTLGPVGYKKGFVFFLPDKKFKNKIILAEKVIEIERVYVANSKNMKIIININNHKQEVELPREKNEEIIIETYQSLRIRIWPANCY